jgi:mannonate dehydratase
MKLTRRTMISSAATACAVHAAPRSGLRKPDAWMPRLSENLADVKPQTLRWLKQLGCATVIYQGTDDVDRDRKGYWTVADILPHKQNCIDAGLTLESMMIPIDTYLQARLGKPGRDREIENVCKTIQAVGQAGIPMMEWRFWPDFYWDSRVGYYDKPGRGGAGFRGFDYSLVKDMPPFPEIGLVSESEMWSRFLYFTKPIVATAEKANVRLSMHPCDPPVATMRGVARIFHSPDNMRRFLQEVPSAHSGITFCQGTFTEMGCDVLQEIKYFAEQKKINLVHFRAVQGTVPNYTEVFIDEGDIDMVLAMKTYKEAGYTGPIVSDHTPAIVGDNGWGLLGRTYSHGFMNAAVHAANLF